MVCRCANYTLPSNDVLSQQPWFILHTGSVHWLRFKVNTSQLYVLLVGVNIFYLWIILSMPELHTSPAPGKPTATMLILMSHPHKVQTTVIYLVQNLLLYIVVYSILLLSTPAKLNTECTNQFSTHFQSCAFSFLLYMGMSCHGMSFLYATYGTCLDMHTDGNTHTHPHCQWT